MGQADIFTNAFAGLPAHKQRSALALLGIVVGISALVAMVALIEGANTYIASRLVTLQPDVLQVSQLPASFLNINDFLKASKWKRIEYEDYLAVQAGSRECGSVGAESDLVGRLKWHNTITGSVQIRGLSAGMFDIERVDVANGRSIARPKRNNRLPSA
jgi:putative ABC transport system permease protein